MKDSLERQKRYHERRRLIQSLDILRREIQVLEAIHEAGEQCWESQASIADRKGISRRTVIRGIDDLMARGWLLEKKRGQGRTNLYSIDWGKVSQPVPPCHIKKCHHVTPRSATVSHLEVPPCHISLVTEERIEVPPKDDGVGDALSIEEKQAAHSLVRSFYSRYERFGRTHEGFNRDVDYIAELIIEHGHEPVAAALRRLPAKLGSNSDRIYLRGCRSNVEALIAGEHQITKQQRAADQTRAELKSQREQWAEEQRRSQILFAWFGDQPPEEQARIRAESEAKIPMKYRGNSLFATSYLADAIQSELQARGIVLEEAVA